MKKQTLTKRITDLVTFCSSDSAPNTAAIVKCLNEILPDVTSLEVDLRLPDLEKENASLKAALKAVNSDLDAAKADCASKVNILQKELDALTKEQAKRDYQEKFELADEQIKILQTLSPKNTGPFFQIFEIHTKLNRVFPTDEIASHLDRLRHLKMVDCITDVMGAEKWFRTNAGNNLAIAHRKAHEDGQSTPRKFPDLAPIEEAILRALVGHDNGIASFVLQRYLVNHDPNLTLPKTNFILETLKEKGFADMINEGDYGTGVFDWIIIKAGSEYLYERNLL